MANLSFFFGPRPSQGQRSTARSRGGVANPRGSIRASVADATVSVEQLFRTARARHTTAVGTCALQADCRPALKQ
eukprot:12668040-Alexandrium_andersonii.AAC.1